MTEEVFHMFTQMGLAKSNPAIFGVDDFTSTMCTEMARHECVQPGWWHEENECPNALELQEILHLCLYKVVALMPTVIVLNGFNKLLSYTLDNNLVGLVPTCQKQKQI